MTRNMFRLVGFFVLGCVSCVIAARASELSDDAIAAQAARFRATVEQDIAYLKEHLHQDLHYAHAKGYVESKSDHLETIQKGTVDYVAISPRDVQARIINDVAVITGLADLKLIVGGDPVELTIRFLEVSVREGSDWKLLAWQSVKFIAE